MHVSSGKSRIVPRIVAAACIALAACAGCAPDAAVPDAAPRMTGIAPPSTHVAAFDAFPGRERIPVRDLFDALSREADRIARSHVVRGDYRQLMAAHGLADDDALYRDYVRIRIAFEATRAGGWWGLEWRVTDQLPQSDRVWAQWRDLAADGDALPVSTAIAECDELSALFAVVARGMGLSPRSRTGLFWPTGNQTVAVWAIAPAPAAAAAGDRMAEARIVVPTSQIFLDGAQGLGTRAFDPWTQAKIHSYGRRDIGDGATLPAGLARHFVRQVRTHGETPRGVLQALRNRREYDQRLKARTMGKDSR